MGGSFQLIFSQVPDFDRLWWLSYVATAMAFLYSFIGLGLCIGKATGAKSPIPFPSLSPSPFLPPPPPHPHPILPLTPVPPHFPPEHPNNYGSGTWSGVEVGVDVAGPADKVWAVFNGLGVIAFAYSFSLILIEVQIWEQKPQTQISKTLSKPITSCIPQLS